MLPEVLAVDDNNRGERGVELIQEAGVDANSARGAVLPQWQLPMMDMKRFYFAPGTTTIHETPNRSVNMPKHGE